MPKTKTKPPSEASLMRPLLGLFKGCSQVAYEVPLGWRKIDLLVFEAYSARWVAIELKVRDWRRALQQAMLNHLVADRSYVALWHSCVPTALKHVSLFEHYRVGIIAVDEDGAKVILEFDNNVQDDRRDLQRQNTLKRLARLSVGADNNAPVPVLSA